MDATFIKGRQASRVVAQAVVIAIDISATTGQREVLDVGPSEDGAFWLSFLRGLVARGLSGMQLVTSDAHTGLKAAICSVLHRASWHRWISTVRSCMSWLP